MPRPSIAAASRAFEGWKRTSPYERGQILRRAADALNAHTGAIQEWIIRESGSIRAKAALEVTVPARECEEAAAPASAPQGELLATDLGRIRDTRQGLDGFIYLVIDDRDGRGERSSTRDRRVECSRG